MWHLHAQAEGHWKMPINFFEWVLACFCSGLAFWRIKRGQWWLKSNYGVSLRPGLQSPKHLMCAKIKNSAILERCAGKKDLIRYHDWWRYKGRPTSRFHGRDIFREISHLPWKCALLWNSAKKFFLAFIIIFMSSKQPIVHLPGFLCDVDLDDLTHKLQKNKDEFRRFEFRTRVAIFDWGYWCLLLRENSDSSFRENK